MKLTKRERHTLTLMTYLASEWESTLADSYNVSGFKPSPDAKKAQRDCQRNIERFTALRDKLLTAENRVNHARR